MVILLTNELSSSLQHMSVLLQWIQIIFGNFFLLFKILLTNSSSSPIISSLQSEGHAQWFSNILWIRHDLRHCLEMGFCSYICLCGFNESRFCSKEGLLTPQKKPELLEVTRTQSGIYPRPFQVQLNSSGVAVRIINHDEGWMYGRTVPC